MDHFYSYCNNLAIKLLFADLSRKEMVKIYRRQADTLR